MPVFGFLFVYGASSFGVLGFDCLSYTEMGAWKPSAGRWKAMQMPLPARPQRHCQLPNLWLGRGASMKHDETGAKDVFLQRVQRNVDIRNWESWFTSELDVEHSTMLFENCKKISLAFGFMYSFHHENPNRQQLQRISRCCETEVRHSSCSTGFVTFYLVQSREVPQVSLAPLPPFPPFCAF